MAGLGATSTDSWLMDCPSGTDVAVGNRVPVTIDPGVAAAVDDGSIAGGGVACTSVLGVAVESESESDVPVGAVAGKLEHAVTSRAAVKASS